MWDLPGDAVYLRGVVYFDLQGFFVILTV